jgi:hypothetical protein
MQRLVSKCTIHRFSEIQIARPRELIGSPDYKFFLRALICPHIPACCYDRFTHPAVPDVEGNVCRRRGFVLSWINVKELRTVTTVDTHVSNNEQLLRAVIGFFWYCVTDVAKLLKGCFADNTCDLTRTIYFTKCNGIRKWTKERRSNTRIFLT